MTIPRINVIADDYGLSPGIGDAIRELLDRGKITGTSCMTLFPEWPDEAKLLRQRNTPLKPDIGLHLTLTDFAPVSRPGADERMPQLNVLLARSFLGGIDRKRVEAELDMQLDRFVESMGRLPDFIDGHQHVHFLAVARRWLETRRPLLERDGRLPWLRGVPRIRLATTGGIKAKVAFISLVAAGFERQMKAAGFPVRGPLTGFYDWKRPDTFLNVIRQLEAELPEDAVVMCHPGWIDETLISRDSMVEARPWEAKALARLPGFRSPESAAVGNMEDTKYE